MHIHLDPVGGLAGDMFAAAVLDAFPEHEAGLGEVLAAAGLAKVARVSKVPHKDHTLTGSRFIVEAEHEAHAHRAYKDICLLLRDSALAAPVIAHAQSMFALLADAESSVHGISIDDVSFHEVGAWDSIADIVCAAWLIDAVGARSWSCAPLPLGGGRVATAHGSLPVPAPATARLLQGVPMLDDGLSGERVTPTGAAIIKHLNPSFAGLPGGATLVRSGSGFGTKTFKGISNIVRILVFDSAEGAFATDQVSVLEFEVDDQSPEDLAIGLDRLRDQDAVLDIVQTTVYGKKNRLTASVRVLALPHAVTDILTLCFVETRTLGVRYHTTTRAVISREIVAHNLGEQSLRVKRATRPDGNKSLKVEAGDLTSVAGFVARDALRVRVLNEVEAEQRMEHDDD